MVSFWRVIKFAFQDIGRNFGMSLMTVFILVLMLMSVNVLWSVDVVTKEAVKLVKNQVNVSVYFNAEAADKDINEIKKYINSFPEVIDLQIQSRDQVLESFRQRHQLSPEVLQSLEELGGNPFGPTIVIRTREPGDYKKIIQALDVPEYKNIIEANSYEGNEQAVERLQNIISRIEQMGLGLSILFALIAFLIIFNTIRVSIYTQRVEISIKRLVGASNWFIRGPYIVESFVYTIIGTLATFGVVFLVLHRLDPYLAVVFSGDFSLTNYYKSHILYLVGVQGLAVLLLTVASSLLAMRRQLKV